MGDISSDSSGGARVVAKKGSKINDDRISKGVKRQNFGLLQLEEQIIALTVDGYSIEEMAMRIDISEPALGVQLTSIYQKLHVSNPFELILFAVFHHLADTDDSTLPRLQKRPRLKNHLWSKSPL